MKKLFGRIIINMLAIWTASYFIRGISFSGLEGLFFSAIIFGIVNTFIKPLLKLLTLPLTIFTLGLFLLIVNGLTVEITAGLSSLNTATFGDSIKAGIIITIANWILQGIFDSKKD